jgi:hypothetical protein
MNLILTLDAEATSASVLATHGRKALASLASASTQSDPVLACLALASEKMLKMTIGAASIANGGTWPAPGKMRSFNHDITVMDQEARASLLRRLDAAAHPGVVVKAAFDSTDITWTGPLLTALSNYGAGGRFYNLDTLAGDEPRRPAPTAVWSEMEQQVISVHPEVLTHLASSKGSNLDARSPLNAHLANAFQSWWELYATAWKHGVFGDEMRPIGFALSLRP